MYCNIFYAIYNEFYIFSKMLYADEKSVLKKFDVLEVKFL